MMVVPLSYPCLDNVEYDRKSRQGIGPDRTRSLRDVSSTSGAGRGLGCFTLSTLRLRRARVDAYVFSVFYWPVTAADVRGGR